MTINTRNICELTDRDRYDTPAVPKGNPYKHLLGIELELENSNVERRAMPAGWVYHEDQSLRNGAEVVLRTPQNGLTLAQSIESFYAQKYKYTNGPRTSTHIHVNMTEDTVGTLRNMFVLAYMLEDAIFGVVEEKRKWTGYCMALSEMPPERVRKFLTAKDTQTFQSAFNGRNPEKYYGFNIMSVYKHGTVEFRHFTGGPSKAELLDWVTLVNDLKTCALKYTMEDIVGLATPDQVMEFVIANFPTWANRLFGVRGIDAILQSLNDVAGMAFEDDMADRRDTLVFVTPTLLRFYTTKILKKEQADHFVTSIRGLEVMTMDEWRQRVQTSQMQASGKSAKKSIAQLAAEYAELAPVRLQGRGAAFVPDAWPELRRPERPAAEEPVDRRDEATPQQINDFINSLPPGGAAGLTMPIIRQRVAQANRDRRIQIEAARQVMRDMNERAQREGEF